MDKYFTYQDIQGHYIDEGTGETILLVHGFASDGSTWQYFKKGLAGYRLLMVDLPGFGESGLPNEGLDIAGMADFIAALLMHAQAHKVHFVGHSMGGYVALAFAERHADKLLTLTMFHSQPFADTDEKRQIRLRSIELIGKSGTYHYIHELYNGLFAPAFVENNGPLVDSIIDRARQQAVRSVQNALLAMANRPDRSAVLKSLAVPVLFIIGSDDHAIPHLNSLSQTHLPNIAEVQILQGVAHMGMYEKERKCTEILLKFIGLDIRA